MTAKWTPGDVAEVKNQYGVWNRAICTVGLSGNTWRFGVALTEQPVRGSDARALVVIDPEDREQVVRLTRAYDAARLVAEPTVHLPGSTILARVDAVRAALRSLVTPPKPPEPTGLGAVVEDAVGARWTLCAPQDDARWLLDKGRRVHWCAYANIAAVKVLSEGVQS